MAINDLMEVINDTLLSILITIDDHCAGLRPWQIIVYTIITTLVIIWTKLFLFKRELTLPERAKKFIFKSIRKMPFIGDKIQSKVNEARKLVSAEKLFKMKPGMSYLQGLPHEGYSESQIVKEVDDYLSLSEYRVDQGKVSGTVYYSDENHTDVMGYVLKKFTWSNPLHSDVFPGLRKMEAEVVRMACDMFHGNPITSCGTVTSGGTESILLAAKAYRDWANEKGIDYPEIVCPESAHAAFEKAAHYFKMKLVRVPLDAKTWKVDVDKMRSAITKNTCMLVGSTPQFPHGMVDPIEEIAALGERYGIPVHVDACLGGFLIAFMDEAGYPIEPFDFRLPGVTSISADTHKYGFAPKGTSCILYSSLKWRTYQYFVSPDWQGGMYATPTFGGSRAGTVIAACWASMIKFGRKGYVDTTRKIVTTLLYITNELEKLDNIYVFGNPQVCVVAIGSLDFDIFRLSSAMVELGWNLNSLQYPSALHLCCTMLHTHPGVADRFVSDVKKCVCEIMMRPKKLNTGAGVLYGMAQTIPDRSVVTELTGAYLDAVYDTTNFTSNGITQTSTHNGIASD